MTTRPPRAAVEAAALPIVYLIAIAVVALDVFAWRPETMTQATEDPEVQELHDTIEAQQDEIRLLKMRASMQAESILALNNHITALQKPPSQAPIGHIDHRGCLITVRPISAYHGHKPIPVYLHPPETMSYGQEAGA